MSFLLTCPACGIREVTDFGFGGEVVPRPKSKPSTRDLNVYNYFRKNVAGVQREWWYHRSGCRSWFIAERDTRTNQVLSTTLPAGGEAMPPSGTPGAGSPASSPGAAGAGGVTR